MEQTVLDFVRRARKPLSPSEVRIRGVHPDRVLAAIHELLDDFELKLTIDWKIAMPRARAQTRREKRR